MLIFQQHQKKTLKKPCPTVGLLCVCSVLPEAENEGDAIEMLREKVNTSQNKNRSRKV